MMFDTSLRRMIFVRKLIFTNPECWIIINAQKSRKNAQVYEQNTLLSDFFHALFPDLFLEAQIRNESSSFAKMHLLDIRGDSQNGLFFLLQHLLQSIKSNQ